MERLNTQVLPGMHGNAVLLKEFQQLAPAHFDVCVQEIPQDGWQYEALVDHFRDTVSPLQQCMLVGESFSGPLVVKLAAAFPHIVKRLVLVATFVTPPTPLLARFLPWSLLFRLPLPKTVVKYLMVGRGQPTECINHVWRQANTAPAKTMAGRMRETIRVDAVDELRKVSCPVLYVQATKDKIVPKRCLAVIEKHVPQLQLAKLPGPHLILQTHPAEAWQQISRFCDVV